MRGPHTWLLMAAATVALLASADPPPASGFSPTAIETRRAHVDGGGSYTDVSVAGLATMLQTKRFVLINVHTPYEGEIPKTDISIPYDEIGAQFDRLPSDKHARVVLYCRSGHMSAIAARSLVTLGYTDVWNVVGGMVAWHDAGRPLVRRGR